MRRRAGVPTRRRDAAVCRGARARVVEKVRQSAQPPADRSRQRWCSVALACPRCWLGCQATASGPQGAQRKAPASPVPLLPITPQPPSRGALRRRAARKVGRPPRASAGDGLRCAAGGARFGVWPPAHPAPSPSSPSAANPARLPYAAGGASAPAAPQGAPTKQATPARPGGMKV